MMSHNELHSLYRLQVRARETSAAMEDARVERDATIVALRDMGETLRAIGKLVGLEHTSVLRVEQKARVSS
jgi:hypothetical protein